MVKVRSGCIDQPSVMWKRCPRCCPDGVALPAEDFPRNRARRDGLGSLCRRCKQRIDRRYWRDNTERLTPVHASQKRIRRNTARRLVAAYLLAHPCVDCDETDPVVLDFDHVEGRKSANVSALVAGGYEWGVISAEIAKCLVRCANCHRRHEARTRGYFRSVTVGRTQDRGGLP
jgi:hypothetical protein